jgi:hypothetical protein
MWLNFQQSGTDTMFLYWPVLLVFCTISLLFFPAPILYHKSREWFLYSNVSQSSFCPSSMADNRHSFGYCLLDYIPLNSGTSFWATCTAQRLIPWV